MPDHTDAAVARVTARTQAGLVAAFIFFSNALLQLGGTESLGDCHLDGVKLMIARHLLGQYSTAIVIEHGEIAQQGEKAAFMQYPFDQYLKIRQKTGANS